MKRRIIALVLACTMLISSGCDVNVGGNKPGTDTETEKAADTGDADEDKSSAAGQGGSPWIDSDLKSNIKENMELSPTDDFHLYVNYDWLFKTDMPKGRSTVSPFMEVTDLTDEKALALLSDGSLKGHDAELIQSYYNAILDRDSRDKAGLTPIMATVEDIKGINSIDELSAFICDYDRSFHVPTFVSIGNIPSFNDSETYISTIYCDTPTLRDAAEYRNRTEMGDRYYESDLYLTKAMLTRLGYSEDEAGDAFESLIDLEGRLAEVMLTQEDHSRPDYINRINNIYKPDELEKMSGSFPLKGLIKTFGYEDAGRYMIWEPAVIDRINELYTEDNLEMIKNYMLVGYVLAYADKLDSEAYDAYVSSRNILTGSTGREKDEKTAFDIVRTDLTTPMDRAYLERYDASEKRERITKICKEVIAVYRDMLKNEDWLSEETRDKAIEKLDTMTINAVYPDKWDDYGSLDLKGLSYFECVNEIGRFTDKLNRTHINGKVDRKIWSMDILEANAYYNPQENSINIILGLLDTPFYYDGMPDEELLGCIGSTIGHEISHAFDTKGSQYDKDGNYTNWWKDEDYAAFKSRAEKLAAYYNKIAAWEGEKVRGGNIQSEAIADMAGIKAMLMIAGERDDFDYDKFFTAYAGIWRKINTYEAEYYYLSKDGHPLGYLRTNVTLQQFDEFYDTYEIKEGDNMYLAPEDRVAVW